MYRTKATHRLYYEHFIGPIPPGIMVCHRCDVRLCVNPSHMFLGTHQDNMTDMHTKKRHAYGQRHGWAKLTEDQARDIKRRLASGEDKRTISSDYPMVTYDNIKAIHRGKSWRYLK